MAAFRSASCFWPPHYRAPASFSEDTIKEAQVKYNQLKESAKKASISLQIAGINPDTLKPNDESKFLDAICDDLNTPNALAVLYEENKNLNNILRVNPVNIDALKESYARVRAYEEVLGIVLEIPHLSEDDRVLYQAYFDAKGRKDYAKSDELRNQLIAKGIF
jgi:cysteinyl-tRNA synthetase